MVHLKKIGSIFHYLRGRMNIFMLVMVEVLLVICSNHFSSQKGDYGRVRNDWGVILSRIHCTEFPMESSFSKDYKVGSYDSSTIGVGGGVGKGRVVPSTTHLNDHKSDFCIDGSNFVSSKSKDYSSIIHSYKYRSYYYS